MTHSYHTRFVRTVAWTRKSANRKKLTLTCPYMRLNSLSEAITRKPCTDLPKRHHCQGYNCSRESTAVPHPEDSRTPAACCSTVLLICHCQNYSSAKQKGFRTVCVGAVAHSMPARPHPRCLARFTQFRSLYFCVAQFGTKTAQFDRLSSL
jgi:hypothetical protein